MASAWLTEICNQYLSVKEADQIHQQFQSESFLPNRQVMWSGMLQEKAQNWADDHNMQTLTTAMGPLKMPGHPSCLRPGKNDKQWSKYNKGASVLFAYYVAHGKVVTVLSPPPPNRFHPLGGTNYQSIEEPILKGYCGDVAVDRIDMIHPSIALAKDFRYQIWPVDETSQWVEKFQGAIIPLQCWRKVKLKPSPKILSPLCSVGRGAKASEGHTVHRGLAEAERQPTSKSNLRMKVSENMNSTGASSLINSAQHSDRKRSVKAERLRKCNNLAIVSIKMEQLSRPKEKVTKKAEKKAKKKAKKVKKQVKIKTVTDTEKPATSRKQELESVKAIRIALITTQNI